MSGSATSDSLVKSIVTSTAIAEQDLNRDLQTSRTRPPLSLISTMPYNMTRMVVRLGPVVNAREAAEAVVMQLVNQRLRTGILGTLWLHGEIDWSVLGAVIGYSVVCKCRFYAIWVHSAHTYTHKKRSKLAHSL